MICAYRFFIGSFFMRILLVFVSVMVLMACSTPNIQYANTSNVASSKIKVLIIDGQNHHHVWPKSTVMLKQYLQETALFTVDVYRTRLLWRGKQEANYLAPYNRANTVHMPEAAIDPSFSPEFENYDVIVSNFGFNTADWPVKTQRAFEQYMENGGGFVSIHSANNSFPNWSAYNLMTGLGGWGKRNEKDGPYVFFSDDGELIKDISPGPAGVHGTRHEFQIQTRESHPIMDGLPKVWMHTKDECYGNLRGPAQNMTIIASAYCPPEERGTGKHEPMLMVLTYGEGRIFHTTLGHQAESYESVGFITTFLRGTQWAATGEVSIAIPDDFPSAEQSSSRAFVRNDALDEAPVDLRVGEGFIEPLGYYEAEPRFSWRLSPDADDKRQSAYQIQVASSPERLKSQPDYWDSNKVFDIQTSWIDYAGKPLSSKTKVYWRVRTWDEKGEVSQWSHPASIELGLLSSAQWQGQWIGHPDTQLPLNEGDAAQPSQDTLATPQYLRKTFAVEKPVKQARLYITAKGIFKPYINGVEVAPADVMLPGWTPHHKRIESLTYDVTALLDEGQNALAASLAGGWYSMRVHNFVDREFRVPARLLAQLEITYMDGSTQVIASDDSWHASINGPIRFASIYDGETYDQNMEMPGWNTVDYAVDDWSRTISEPIAQAIEISPKRHAPIRVTQQLPVVDIIPVSPGKVIFDFGQNMVGVPRFSLPVIAGQEVTVRYAEALHLGEFYTDNYRSAKSMNRIIPSVSGTMQYEPTFTYHGYRYIEISGFDETKAPRKSWARAQIQHSDVKLHATFTSSHPKLNKLSENILWGLRSNFFDIPLDCPQRDERLGWTGDAQVFVTSSMYMSDVYGFWSAWLKSVREEQGPDGKIPLYIPFVEWINFASSGWGDAVTIIPWELYMMTGDETILADNYEMMQGWLNYHEKNSNEYISSMMTFGDWLQPYSAPKPKNRNGQGGNRGDTNFSLIGTAFYARSVELTMKAAEVLGKDTDVAALSELHTRIKAAFMGEYFDSELNLRNATATQTTYLLGLAFDLFPESKVPVAVAKLIDLIGVADNHLRTGFLGTPLLTQVLQEAGRSDLAYELLFKESYPSWFYSINNGATTTWERWNSYSIEEGFNPEGMNSLNHYAYGTVSRWFYEGILGITPASPGFKSIHIEPQFGAQLNAASGGYMTPHGLVNVDWQIGADSLDIVVTIPKNTSATLVLPIAQYSNMIVNGEFVTKQTLDNLMPGTYRVQLTR